MEFVAHGAADGAGIGEHCAELQFETGEDAFVGPIHVPVFGFQPLGIDVERVRVLHQELARAHDAESRADLVAELPLDLEEVERQLLVGLQFGAGEVGDDFLMGGAEAVLGVLAVADLEQLPAELLPASGLLPQLLRLDGRHQNLDGAGRLHLLAHHGFDLAQHAQAERGPGVDAGRQLADHAGTQHQLVAGDLGVGGNFLDGVQMETGQAHDRKAMGKTVDSSGKAGGGEQGAGSRAGRRFSVGGASVPTRHVCMGRNGRG